ncbi:4Fe-4S dicluster domain-containing protein [Candidatus Bathyarchaeota archaeon]|nr:4Fe-4S dicluster domain-containing protein [Candidatus Bathyarchaeota archaeon]
MSFKVDEKEVRFITLMLQRSVAAMHAEVCEQCGKCSSACPVSKEIEGFNPRQLIAKVALGKMDELLEDEAIWTCTTCLKCRERCPEEISPYDVILVLRNLAYRAGYSYPGGYDDFVEGIKKTGFISEPVEARARGGGRVSRESFGLPAVSGPRDMGAFRGIVEGMIEAGKGK